MSEEELAEIFADRFGGPDARAVLAGEHRPHAPGGRTNVLDGLGGGASLNERAGRVDRVREWADAVRRPAAGSSGGEPPAGRSTARRPSSFPPRRVSSE